jgi:hypothetical protein
MKLLTRLHEWAADHFAFIQYPNVRGPKPPFFRHEMPWTTRVFLLVMGLIMAGAGLLAFSLLVLVVYSVMS